MLAFQKAGIKVDIYYAYEIDKYAVQTATHNFPLIQECGDVFNADFSKYHGIDYLVGGSPCTFWSIAQSPDRRETTASGMGWELFSQYVRALHEAKPKFFIYENNKSMSKAIRESITQTFGFEPICINSALVSAQNRQRLYWVGKRNADGTYSKVDVEQPDDRGILLRDVLDGADLTNCEKAYCLTSSYDGACAWNTIERHQRSMVAEPVGTTNNGKAYCLSAGYSNGSGEKIGNYAAHTLQKGCKSMVAKPMNTTIDGKSQTLKAQYSNTDINNICRYTSTYGASGVAEPVDKSIRVGIYPTSDGRILNSQGMRIYSVDGKSITQSAQGGGMGAKTGLYAIPIESGKELTENEMDYMVRGHSDRRWNHCQRPKQDEKSKCLVANISKGIPYNVCAIPIEFDNDIPVKAISAADGKTYTVYEVKDGSITIKGKTYPIKLVDGYYIIRKLTVSECKRLQTVPEWYEFPVSNTQAYKMLGNGWTVDVITHLINSTLCE